MSLRGRARRIKRLTKRAFWRGMYRLVRLPAPDFDYLGNRFKHPGIELLALVYERYKRKDAEREMLKGFTKVKR